MKYEAGEFVYNNIICSTYSIFRGEITTSEVDRKQNNLISNISKQKADKQKKRNAYESKKVLYESREFTLNVFRSRIFPIKPTQGKGL